jgi:predicted nucleic acid-binding protein
MCWFTATYATIIYATRITERYGFSFYDCLIISSCLAIGCKVLFSEDLQHGQLIDGILEIKNPFNLLRGDKKISDHFARGLDK